MTDQTLKVSVAIKAGASPTLRVTSDTYLVCTCTDGCRNNCLHRHCICNDISPSKTYIDNSYSL